MLITSPDSIVFNRMSDSEVLTKVLDELLELLPCTVLMKHIESAMFYLDKLRPVLNTIQASLRTIFQHETDYKVKHAFLRELHSSPVEMLTFTYNKNVTSSPFTLLLLIYVENVLDSSVRIGYKRKACEISTNE